ncbi:MAG: dihydrofolate reductase [Elainellaceae cyanobacterium]
MDELVLIAAIAASNRVIGDRGQLPWHIPEDLRRFKQLTLGHTVIMGRRTWESLPGALPQRHNIVVSTQLLSHAEVVSARAIAPETSPDIVPSLEAAFRQASTPRVFIIGGATLYAQTLARADRIELTLVKGHYSGDVLFPPYQTLLDQAFQQICCQQHLGFRFETYRRSPKGNLIPDVGSSRL